MASGHGLIARAWTVDLESMKPMARHTVLCAITMAMAGGMPAAGQVCSCGQRPLAIPSAVHTSTPTEASTDSVSRGFARFAIAATPLEGESDFSLSKESEAYNTVRALLPPRFVEIQTRRFIVLSDASPQWTREQAERLERAHHQFMRFCSRLELEPLPLEHKLVCVLFERLDDYRAFAADHDDVRDEWIAGYYSPYHDRIVFYNVESPSNHDPGDPPAKNNHVRTSIATTIHEAIHQLAFHTRIQSPYVRNPLWISEGLATAFETDAPNCAFGPDHEYAPRREAFARLLEGGDLLPLRELVSISNLAGMDERTVQTFYQQSYALTIWMSRFRRAELREYLDLLRREKPGEISSERLVELFTKAFGAIEPLEQSWLRHEN